MKTRVVTAAVGLCLLAVVLAFFDTVLFDLVLALICLIGMHEVYSAMGFGRRQWYLYAVAVPYTMLIMLSSSAAVRALVLPASFLVVLYYNICLIARHQTLDFTKLAGFVYFSGVILFCFYSLVHLKRTLPTGTYGYDAVYFILLILCFAWGGDTMAYFTGRAFGRRKLAPLVSPHKTVEGAAGGLAGSVEQIAGAAPDAAISDNIFDCYEEDAASSQQDIQGWVAELGFGGTETEEDCM